MVLVARQITLRFKLFEIPYLSYIPDEHNTITYTFYKYFTRIVSIKRFDCSDSVTYHWNTITRVIVANLLKERFFLKLSLFTVSLE